MRCVECKYRGDEECIYLSCANALYQSCYGDVSEYKNRFEVADKVLTETREKLTKAEHDRDRCKAEIEMLKAYIDHQIDATNDAENLADHLKYVFDKARKQAQTDVRKETAREILSRIKLYATDSKTDLIVLIDEIANANGVEVEQ